MIYLQAIEVRFGSVLALALPSLRIERGERLGVRGANGSGKSTLMRLLAGLLRPTAGRIEGLPLPGRVVLVHQRPYLFRGTVEANVAYSLRLHGRPPQEAIGWLRRLGADHLADRRAQAVSGGEARRVAIARALATDPQVLLLDEPFAGLDPAGTDRLCGVLEAFQGTLVIAAPDLAGAPIQRVFSI